MLQTRDQHKMKISSIHLGYHDIKLAAEP